MAKAKQTKSKKTLKSNTPASKKKRVVSASSKKTVSKKTSLKNEADKKVNGKNKLSPRALGRSLKSGVTKLNDRRKDFLSRRPHRSFQLTRRRDYARSLKMPGYFMFTIEVAQTLWRHKNTYLLLALVYSLLIAGFGLLGSQAIYTQMSELIDTTAPEGLLSGVMGEVGRAGIILTTALSAGLTASVTPTQQLIAGFMALYVWLTVVWLLRNQVAGKKVALRDGLYSAGAPILSTFLVTIVLLIQLIPMAIAVIVAVVGWQTEFIPQGAISFVVAMALALVVILSLYWIVSTLIALVVITLPGMRPFRALAIAGDLVIGRRLRLVYRIIWLAVTIVSTWAFIAVPVILLDGWLSDQFAWIEAIPIVPILILIMSVMTVIWTAAYVYLLYRKVVDDDADPA